MKQRVLSHFFRFRNYFLFIIPILISLTATSQLTKYLQSNAYKNILKPADPVTIKTIEGGKIESTVSTWVSSVKVTGKRQVITYSEKILAIDTASYQKLKVGLHLTGPSKDIKVIPEIHVDPYPGQTEPCVYRIFFSLEQPLQYNDTLKKFSGLLGFFLAIDTANNTPLTHPVDIEVTSSEVLSINPESLKIYHLNIPSTKIQLIADRVRDSAAIKVITEANPDGYTTYLKVTPRLVISTNQITMAGLGIQKIPVDVMFEGSSSSDSVTVNFSTQRGTVTPNSVFVHYNTPTTVYLRSDGIGTSTLSAVSTFGNSNELIFVYTFPWLFLLAAIAGGLIGSFAKYLLSAENKQSVTKSLVGGILTGIIGAVAYYGLGLNLLGVNISAGLNTLAVFALSALCAYFGITLLKQVQK